MINRNLLKNILIRKEMMKNLLILWKNFQNMKKKLKLIIFNFFCFFNWVKHFYDIELCSFDLNLMYCIGKKNIIKIFIIFNKKKNLWNKKIIIT